MTKRKGDFRSRIDRILAEAEAVAPAAGAGDELTGPAVAPRRVAVPEAEKVIASKPMAVRSATGKPAAPPLRFEEESDVRTATASVTALGTLTQPGPRPSRSRAMAGWYVFLAVLVAASFSVTNLALNHDTSLSIETGAIAGIGLVVVVILLVTGR